MIDKRGLWLSITALGLWSTTARADDPPPARIDALEKRMGEVESRLDAADPGAGLPSWVRRFTLGGYGEIHANFGEGSAPDQMDIHRLVISLGYEFEEWLTLASETEIEHAFVSEDDGEIAIEQLSLDLSLSDALNVRAGRVLTPVGVVNLRHEPPSFNGVERPLFSTVIVPTTWSSDGIGIFGKILPELKYQAYVVAGLDGSLFTDTNGIRGGRIKERPSLKEPAGAARFDVYPFARAPASYRQVLRFGVSGYYGGLDNGDQGNNPGLDGDLVIGAVDCDYSIGPFDFRGAFAYEKITGARQIGGGVASDLYGYFVEVAAHVLPESWKRGRARRADLVLFARFDSVDTQHQVPGGVVKNRAGDREEVTLGFTCFVNPSVAVKGDVQLRNDRETGDLNTLANFGIGWEF